LDNLSRLLNKRQPKVQNAGGFFVSAVLLPIIETGGEHYVLFEVRAGHLRRQPGEICFPGGKVEQSEFACPQETAIRETVEELGIDRAQVELIGPLDYVISPLGALIYPYVGMIAGHNKMAPNPAEVEEVFLVPVKHFLTNPPFQSSVEVAVRYAQDFPFDRIPPYYRKEWRTLGSFPVYFYEYGNRLIWGATAGILHNFINLCYKKNDY